MPYLERKHLISAAVIVGKLVAQSERRQMIGRLFQVWHVIRQRCQEFIHDSEDPSVTHRGRRNPTSMTIIVWM
jgi:hypothetical protein